MIINATGPKADVLTAINDQFNAGDLAWKGYVKEVVSNAINALAGPNVRVAVNWSIEGGLHMSVQDN